MVAKGSIVDIIYVSDKVINIIIKYRKGDNFIHLCFTAYQDILVLIKQIRLEKRDVVKITYFLQSRKHENKWYTSAIIEKINIIAKKPEQLMVDMETGEIL
jgi:enamine deaminase RidA (YjgF/YER057c/UK114 family)